LSSGARRFAVIDIGTTSVKLAIGERRPDGAWEMLVDRAEVTRLGEGLGDTGSLKAEALERTLSAVEGMVSEAHRWGTVAVAAVGTAGLRQAANSEAFLAAVHERAGVVVEIISGEEEGRLAYLAARSGLDLGDEPEVVFETGGGSSQFTFGSGDAVRERFSLDVGAARFTDRYGLDEAVDEEALDTARRKIETDLSRLEGKEGFAVVVGMGGAVTNLAAVAAGLSAFDPAAVHGSELTTEEVDRQIDLYRSRGSLERRTIAGLQPERAAVILAGACIVRAILAKLRAESLLVSARGLRHGVMIDRFSP
jgi:exopolyphosphatase/guanosine-5'-triphosphate,3'-diphosphate pyrophosphatase